MSHFTLTDGGYAGRLGLATNESVHFRSEAFVRTAPRGEPGRAS